MKVHLEFTRRATPQRQTVVREMIGVPRIGDHIEQADGDAAGEVRHVTWMHDGSVIVQVMIGTNDEFPTS